MCVCVCTLNSMLSLMWTFIATSSPSLGLPSCAILSSSVISASSWAGSLIGCLAGSSAVAAAVAAVSPSCCGVSCRLGPTQYPTHTHTRQPLKNCRILFCLPIFLMDSDDIFFITSSFIKLNCNGLDVDTV